MQAQLEHSIVIYCDGACSGNPGPGGWGSIVAFPNGKVIELAGRSDKTTNNKMELIALAKALQYINESDKKELVNVKKILILTDSVYVIRGATQWIWGWKKRKWQTAEGEAVSNRDEWEFLDKELKSVRQISEFHYCRGHTGVPGNERCDEIAVAGSQKKWIDLYDGPLIKYPVALFDFPEDTSIPEMKQKEDKKSKVAFSYLSLLDGVVIRHKDWPSCEKRVKGRSGAKFKKAMSVSDETEIVLSWKADPSKIKDEN